MLHVENKIQLEKELTELHNRKHCVFVSRGTVAIYLAIKSLNFKEGKVVLPAIMCLSPANAVIYAGLKPIFCDINLNDYNFDLKELEKTLIKNNDIRAIVLPHMFGEPTDIDAVIALAKKFNVKVIEDVAQAMGGTYKDQSLGSFGDFSILSFGHTKIIDVGEGGAILFDDEKHIKPIKNALKEIPEKISSYKELQQKYSEMYYELKDKVKTNKLYEKMYYPFPYIFKDLYLYKNYDPEIINKILVKLNQLNEIVEIRKEKSELYRKLLLNKKIKHPKYKGNGVCWRYSFLYKNENQVEFSELLRKSGIDVSNWYPPLHRFYELKNRKLKNAEYFGKHVINLWVTENISKETIKKNIGLILKTVEKNEK